MRGESEVQDRRRLILAALVRRYILTGVPVGSKTIAAQLQDVLSPASIRNVMYELESDGFLEQPHTSAGRVPTDKAYRLYVDHLMKKSRLSASIRTHIERALPKLGVSAQALMMAASRLLSEVSRSVGLVLGVSFDEHVLQQINFLKLPERRVLAVVVSRPEVIENRAMELEEDISQADLDRVANYLNAEFRGWTLRTIRMELTNRIDQVNMASGKILSDLAALLRSGALGQDEPGPLFVDGTAKILDHPAFDDVRELKAFIAALDEKSELIHALNVLVGSAESGVQVSIGRENPSNQMRHCALVVAPLQYGARAVGVLGVVGPTRMEYDRAVTAVDLVAHRCSCLLTAN